MKCNIMLMNTNAKKRSPVLQFNFQYKAVSHLDWTEIGNKRNPDKHFRLKTS